MGVDSGVGTFRGVNAGKWPPLEERKMDFSAMSNPSWFEEDGDPHLAFGFWYWRYNGYVNAAKPHEGYYILQRWAKGKPYPAMSFTSNIDGHWLEAGMAPEEVVEIHGSIRFWQCRDYCKDLCTDEIWPDTLDVKIDPQTHKALDPLPLCKNCNRAYKRPNVCMFGDFGWQHERTSAQEERWSHYIKTLRGKKVVVIELGAGTAIPSVRLMGEKIVRENENAHLIRINLEQPQLTGAYSEKAVRGLAFPCGALKALKLIDECLSK